MRYRYYSAFALVAFCLVVAESTPSRSLLGDIYSRRKHGRIARNAPPFQESNDKETSGLTTVVLAVILPSDQPYLFRKKLVQPAIEYAVQSVRSEMASMGYKFQTEYRNSYCNRRAALAAVDMYYGDDAMYNRSTTQRVKNDLDEQFPKSEDESLDRRQRSTGKGLLGGDWPSSNGESRNRDLPLVFLGPACNQAASIVSTFAESWNVPLLTSGAPAAWITPGPDYPTLTRVGPSHADLAYFVASIFQILRYDTGVPIHLLYEDSMHGVSAERECFYVMQAVYHVLNRNLGVHISGPTYVPPGSEFDEYTIAREMRDPRVVVMCGSSDVVRQVMIGAYKTGNANPAHSVWYAIDLHNSSHYLDGAWRRGDKDDKIAKEAYKALQLITVYSKNNLRFKNFVNKMSSEYVKAGIQGEVNEFVIGFHDAIILYTEAVRRTLRQGIDIRNGLAISKNMRNITINGIAGPVVMGMRGDRHGDYSILAMTDHKTGTFSSVYDYLGTFEAIHDHGLQRLDLSDVGTEQNYSVIQSGVDVEKILAELDANREKARRLAASTTNHEILAGILGTFGGMILCCALIFGPMCYQRKHRSRTSVSENGNGFGQFVNGNSDQVCLHRPLREEGSVATCTTSIEDEQKL